jgi:hypothetical protein
MPNVLSEYMMNMIKKRMTMDETDESAFDSMQSVTKDKSSNLFTESEYNINATHEERMGYDSKAYEFLHKLYREDKDKISDIKDWEFDRYLSNLKGSYLEEKFINAKEGDPDYYSKAGDMLRSVYSDDVDQMILSARNFKGDDPSRIGKNRSRANVSIKAPGAESY